MHYQCRLLWEVYKYLREGTETKYCISFHFKAMEDPCKRTKPLFAENPIKYIGQIL